MSSIKNLEDLRKELLKTNSDTHSTWINEDLGGANDGLIAGSNLWYGEDITKKEKTNKNDILILFPNSKIFNSKKIKTRKELEKIIYDTGKWKNIKLKSPKNDAGLIGENVYAIEKHTVALGKNDQIKSIDAYFNYLIKKGKISKSSKILQKAKEEKELLRGKFKKAKEATKEVATLTKSKNKSIKEKLSAGKKLIKNAIKDIKLYSLAKQLFIDRKENKKLDTYGCVYYNSKLFNNDISNKILDDNNEENKPYWYGNILFVNQKDIKQDHAVLLFPASEAYINKDLQPKKIKALEKNVLNINDWKELSIEKSKLNNLDYGKKFEQISFYIEQLEKIVEYYKLISLIDQNKEKLSNFYNKNKGRDLPYFANYFPELKSYLNGGKSGAKELVFDDFLKEHIKKLDPEGIKKVIELIEGAVKYVTETSKSIKKLKSDKDETSKKAKKVVELYEFRSNCSLFKDLAKTCEDYIDTCLKYLPKNSKKQFEHNFAFFNLKNEAAKELIPVYEALLNIVTRNLLDGYKNGKLFAKLHLIDQHDQMSEENFEQDITNFKNFKSKTKEFLTNMHNEAAADYPLPSFVPDPPIKKADKIFDAVINKLTEMKNNWNNL